VKNSSFRKTKIPRDKLNQQLKMPVEVTSYFGCSEIYQGIDETILSEI
jgi:hypothetical protein